MAVTAVNLWDRERGMEAHPISDARITTLFESKAYAPGLSAQNDDYYNGVQDNAEVGTVQDGDVEALAYLPPYDQRAGFDSLLRRIERMRWQDPVGAAHKLLEIQTQNLPFGCYEAYSALAENLGAQLQTMEGAEARIALWDLDRNAQDVQNTLDSLFGVSPEDELLDLLGGQSLQGFMNKMTDFVAEQAQADEENGLPPPAVMGKLAVFEVLKHEADRLESLPKGQYNPEALAADERRLQGPAFAPGLAA